MGCATTASVSAVRAAAIGAALLCLPGPLAGQNWKGILSPARAADWSQAGLPGGIPNRTTVFRTLGPGVTAEQINAAIASCPRGQVVYLGPGTYELSNGIDFANHCDVTLRGAGADRTFLIFTASTERRGISADISIENFDANLPHGESTFAGGPSNRADWTA